MPSFSERIKELRQKNKVTQKSVAESVSMSERNYIDLEHGKFKPNHDNIIKLADYFDVSADYILGRSDNPSRK